MRIHKWRDNPEPNFLNRVFYICSDCGQTSIACSALCPGKINNNLNSFNKVFEDANRFGTSIGNDQMECGEKKVGNC